MRTMIAAVLVTMVAGSASAQDARTGGTCKANQSGNVLLTSIEYDDGYKVVAPWRVLSSGKSRNGSAQVTAIVDHIIETDPVTRKQKHTPLPGAIELTFQGQNSTLMLREAADIWCSTVEKAMGARASDPTIRAPRSRVVM
jgi:hypothetical protein